MAIETEIKFRVDDVPALSLRLQRAGFRLQTQRSFETNVLYDTPDRAMRARTEILRIRSYDGRWTVTHKRPPSSGPGSLASEDVHKHRVETETEVADGAVLAELSEFLGIQTNNFAEYSGLLASLDYALGHGHRRLRVVSDSELMVKQIQGKYQVKSPVLRPLFDQAKKKIALLDGFEIVHALRHKNKDADRLANEAMDRGMGR